MLFALLSLTWNAQDEQRTRWSIKLLKLSGICVFNADGWRTSWDIWTARRSWRGTPERRRHRRQTRPKREISALQEVIWWFICGCSSSGIMCLHYTPRSFDPEPYDFKWLEFRTCMLTFTIVFTQHIDSVYSYCSVVYFFLCITYKYVEFKGKCCWQWFEQRWTPVIGFIVCGSLRKQSLCCAFLCFLGLC